MRYRCGVDVGETFTDLLLLDDTTGALWVARNAGLRNILTLDVGGTSTDVALVENGDPRAAKIRDHELWIDGGLRRGAIYERKRLRAGDVIRGTAIVVEMDATTLVRTAMSPGIREQGDAFPLIADPKGRMIVGQFGSYIGAFLDGDDACVCACEELLQRNRRAMQQLIDTQISDGKLNFTDYVCDDGLGRGPYAITCTMWRESGRVVLDFAGTDRHGKDFQLFQIGFGGIPGRPLGDGPDGHSLVPNFTNVPNEFLERYFPLVIERYETEADSGGAGMHRGGNGIHMSYRFLEPGRIAIHDDRWFVAPRGVNGGATGARARKVLEKADGTTVVLGSKIQGFAVEAGDLLHFITWGGGGWGDPLERDPEIVALEIRRGLVTAAGARAYGVVVDPVSAAVNVESTIRLRADLKAARAPPALFDFGPPVDELRRRCLQDTGLPAPRAAQEDARFHAAASKP
jgi:N-methylhydantoinase B/oxoprolinase/acetone carboxylase alpha subunit